MPGVREDLILDITSAQRSIDALEAQVTAAFSRIDVELDTAGISQEISRAVAAADTTTSIEADTTGVASEITRAVDRADASVEIRADTTAARVQVNHLEDDIKRTTGSAGALGVALSGAALLVAGRGLFSLAEASSAVNEQLTGSEIVFGNLAPTVQRFADQADRLGLANVQALQLSNNFGQLALSAGLSDTAVADFATTIVERGADIASLRDIDLTQTLDALRSGLVGETEPLRNIGIFMNEALVQSEAYRLGIAELGTELTDAQKIQARYAIILEQSEIAAGNFALTQEGLANTQRQIRAEVADLAAESGALLEPSFLRLAGLTRDELLPSLAELAEDALPAVGSILESLAPLLGVTLDLLVAGAPVLQLTADILDAIPDPLIAIAAGWLAINRAQKLADLVGLTPRLGRLRSGVTGLATDFGKLDGASRKVGIGVGLAAIAGIVAVGTKSGAADGLAGIAGSIFEIGDAITGASSDRAAKLSVDIEKIIGGFDTSKANESILAVRQLGREYHDLIGVLGSADDETLFSFGDKAIFTSTTTRDVNERAEALDTQITALQDSARAEVEAGIETGRFTDAQIKATYAQAQRVEPTVQIIEQLRLLQIEEQKSARLGELTIDKYSQVAAAYIGTADAAARLQAEAPFVATAVTRVRNSGADSHDAFLDLATAIDGANLSGEGLADTAALLGTDVETLSTFVDTLTGALESFIETAVSGLPTVSDVLGGVQTDVQNAASESAQAVRDAAEERATAVLDAANDRIAASELSEGQADRIREAGEERAQAIRDAGEAEAAAIEENADVSVSQFTEGLRKQAEELADFRSDLEALTAAGFGDVAGLLAEQGFEAGNAFADELNAALESGNTELIEGLREANDLFRDESTATVDFIRDELGPELLSVTGLIAGAITEAFGSDLDFEERIRIATELAKAELDPQAEQIAAVAAVKGAAAARAYGDALKLDKEVIDAGIAAGVAIQENAPTAAAKAAGEATSAAFAAGLGVTKFQVDIVAATNVRALREGGEYGPGWRLVGEEGPELEFMSRSGFIATAQQFATAVAATRVPDFGLRALGGGGGTGGGQLRIHPDDIAALAAQIQPSITVHNPKATTAESSIRREMTGIRLRSDQG